MITSIPCPHCFHKMRFTSVLDEDMNRDLQGWQWIARLGDEIVGEVDVNFKRDGECVTMEVTRPSGSLVVKAIHWCNAFRKQYRTEC